MVSDRLTGFFAFEAFLNPVLWIAPFWGCPPQMGRELGEAAFTLIYFAAACCRDVSYR